MAKAGRDMLHQVIALENPGPTPRVKTLSYSPGACDTDMQAYVRTEGTSDAQKKLFSDMKTEVRTKAVVLWAKPDLGFNRESL